MPRRPKIKTFPWRSPRLRRFFHRVPLVRPANCGKPRTRSAFGESGAGKLRIRFKLRGFDRLDLPPVGERCLQFVFCDAPRTELAGLGVAEAHQEQSAFRVRDVSKPGYVLLAIFVRKRMKQAG